MKLSIVGLTLASAILWGLSVFVVGYANLNCIEGYGAEFLKVMSSIYPGYDAMATWRSVLVGTGYAVVDGAITGLLFSILYNLIARCCGSCCCKNDQTQQPKPQ